MFTYISILDHYSIKHFKKICLKVMPRGRLANVSLGTFLQIAINMNNYSDFHILWNENRE